MAGMAYAWIGRGDCGITGECFHDNAAVTRQYQAAVLSALLSQLRPGDIVAILQNANLHLNAHAMEWYDPSRSTVLPCSSMTPPRLIVQVRVHSPPAAP